jgi:uncharacterized protein (DUF58 family)
LSQPRGLRATRRLLHMGALIATAIVTALWVEAWIPAAAAIPLLGLVLFAFFESVLPMPSRIERRMDVPPKLLVGDEVRFDVHATPAFLPQNIQLDEGLPEGLQIQKEGRRAFESTRDGGAVATYHAKPRRRGEYAFDPATLRRVSALGLFERAEPLFATTKITVLPTSAKQLGVRVRPRPPQRTSELSKSLRAGPGDEFFALREYLPGDSLSNVNWKASARMQRIITNEYLPQEPPRYLLYVDTRGTTAETGEVDAFERTLELAAILIDALLEARAHVGLVLLSFHSVFLVPQTGANQLRRLRQLIVDAKPGQEAPLLQLLYAGLPHLPARCDAILLTANAYDATLPQAVTFLRARHGQCSVIFPGFPEPQGKDLDTTVQRAAGVLLNTEQAAVLTALRPFATQVIQWPPDEAVAVTLSRLGMSGRKR